MRNYKGCVDNSSEQWYLKGTCYNNTNMIGFFRELNDCVHRMGFVDKLTDKADWKCSVDMVFTFTDHYPAEKWLRLRALAKHNKNSSVVNLFKTFDSCEDKWILAGKEITLGTTTTGTFLLDLNYKNSKDAAKIGQKLQELRVDLDTSAQEYCAEARPKSESFVDCSRSIVRPVESYSTEEYFTAMLNRQGASFFDLKRVHWPLALSLVLAWLLVGLGVSKGVKLVGKIVYFTAIFPIIMVITLCIYSAFLDGQKKGVEFYLRTRWCQLRNPELWYTFLVHSRPTAPITIACL